MIDRPEITIDELMQVIQGPDFPTGGLIQGRRGIQDATGRAGAELRSEQNPLWKKCRRENTVL